MHWHILGAGAIGLLWATKLIRGGCSVTLILRDPQKLERYRQQSQISLEQAQSCSHFAAGAELLDSTTAIDNLLICTKAYDCESAFEAIQRRLRPTANVLLLHNGMGPQQRLAAQYPRINIWAGSTTDGSYLKSPFHVVQAGIGETRIGALSDSTRDGLYRALNPVAGPLIHEAQIIHTLWRKLAINCAINPLTAIHNCKNGVLVSNPEYRTQMQAICVEVEQVAERLGIPLFATPLIDQASQVAAGTAANSSSMRQDILHGRPTEIETITGFLCRQARQAKIATPLNDRLLARIRQLSAQP